MVTKIKSVNSCIHESLIFSICSDGSKVKNSRLLKLILQQALYKKGCNFDENLIAVYTEDSVPPEKLKPFESSGYGDVGVLYPSRPTQETKILYILESD